MTKALILGASGQVGSELMLRGKQFGLELVGSSYPELDIRDLDATQECVLKHKAEVIINAAAYTAVDNAEDQQAEAFAINRDGARNVALAASKCGARLIHLSTDYVYSGKSDVPIIETEAPNPLSIYGSSKWAGDLQVREVWGECSLIVRTSSVHGRYGANFVRTMLKLAGERDELKIVSDQIMSPTWAGWLAETLLQLAKLNESGVIHAACSGAVSWFDFTREIFELAKPAKYPKLTPVTLEQWPAKATRPRFSVLDCSKLIRVLGRRPISWQDGLKKHLQDIGALVE